ncbi:MAG TPA: glycosyltransferase family 4 protein [Alphaproteobacteria bacterium]|nr:glycosyltransferase family 4 protein [Alphaproteobacteria bacterium]USO04990.1 MAG: glycosyltransferase family 4 protein [Rhodospirillales bacterium]HOO82362.1 glycosyltransferase family 4 protein [Alphaproteobacteria bacterium]
MAAKKLLLVINHIDWFWSHRLPLAKGAQVKGWDVSVAVTGADSDPDLAPQHFTGHELPASGPAKIIWAIYKIIKREHPAIIHAITLKYAFFAGLAARLYKDVRVVHTLAGLGYLFSGEGAKPQILRIAIGPFLKLALKQKRTHLIFQNPDDMALMIRRRFAVPERCTLIRGSGVDLTQYPLMPLPEDKRPIVLMPTRLIHEKGVAVFIKAANILKKRGINARFKIAGGLSATTPSAISKEEMETMLAESEVEWLGKVADMPALYQSASLICYPSWYGEGVPKVLLEAAATGRAIVTTDHPGCREAVEHEVNGLLVPVKDPLATADAMRVLLEDRPCLEAMGRASHDLAARNFDVESVVAHTLKIYEEISKA